MSFTEKTIAELGAIISSPKLSEKLLSKPPFRFLHDIVTSFVKATGFLDGLYPPEMLDSSQVTEKEAKLEFLRLLIAAVEAATGATCSAKPAKIIAGQEPENTNQMLQLLASCAALSKEQKDAACQKAKGAGSPPKRREETKPKETDEERHKRKEEERRKEKEKEQEKTKEKETDEERRKRKEEERRKEKEKEKEKEKLKEKESDDERRKRKEKEKEEEQRKEKEKEEERRKRKEEDRKKEKEKEEEQRKEKEKEDERRKRKEKEKEEEQRKEKEKEEERRKRKEEEQRKEKEKEEEQRKEKEKEEERRKRKEEERKKEKENEKPKETEEERQKRKEEEHRKRKEEERRKEKDRERDEEAQRHLETSSHIHGVIRETKPGEEATKDVEKDENDWQKIAEKYEHRSAIGDTSSINAKEEDVKGALGLQALKAKREQEELQRKAEEAATSKPAGPGIVIRGGKGVGRTGNAAVGENDLNKLREQLQMLTKASNPLGKFLEAIYDDIDSMIRELEMWRSESRNQALGAAEARRQTEESLQEVHAQLQALEDAITDQILKTNHLHQSIIANDAAMEGMIKMVVNPDVGKN